MNTFVSSVSIAYRCAHRPNHLRKNQVVSRTTPASFLTMPMGRGKGVDTEASPPSSFLVDPPSQTPYRVLSDPVPDLTSSAASTAATDVALMPPASCPASSSSMSVSLSTGSLATVGAAVESEDAENGVDDNDDGVVAAARGGWADPSSDFGRGERWSMSIIARAASSSVLALPGMEGRKAWGGGGDEQKTDPAWEKAEIGRKRM